MNCENKLQTKCRNCLGKYPASSSSCPVYINEMKIREIRAKHNCGYREAESIQSEIRNEQQ